MCGRFTLTGDLAKFAESIGAKGIAKKKPRYNICPTQDVAVVLNLEPRAISTVKWGLIPFWAEDPKIGNSLANARSEGIESKPSFRSPFKRQRCLVLADGFYEWQKVPGSKAKVPHYFRLKSHDVFGFAGLWDVWADPAGAEIQTCCLITTTPNSLMEPIHDRMPVILHQMDYDIWLSAYEKPSDQLVPLLKPYPASEMESHPVSTLVNRPQNDEARVIEPVGQ